MKRLLPTILLTATLQAHAGYGFGDESCYYYGTSEPVCFVNGEAPEAYPGQPSGESGDPNSTSYWVEFWLMILWFY